MKRSSLFVCLILLFLLVMAGIPIAAASPTISSITPQTAPNNGVVTITYTGTGFNKDSSVWLIPCDMSDRVTGTITSVNPTSLTARFSFNGHSPVGYNVWVNSPWTDSYGNYYPQDTAVKKLAFTTYQGTGTTYTTTPTTGTTTAVTTVMTTVTSGEGENSVFFESNPTGAEIFLNGDDVGTSAFVYNTNKDGTFDVVVKKIGYEDYAAKVTILKGKRVSFYALLTQLSSDSTAVTTPVSGTPVKTVTTIRKSTLKIPTPLGTDPPVTEESPLDPALALGAAVIAIGLVLVRRR